MRTWAEFIEFVRGTRERPPPGPPRPLATLLLVLASLAHLPVVYGIVRDGTLAPPIGLLIGLLSMGLAWASGVSLEGRRIGTARALAALGVAEGALALVPAIGAALDGARWLLVVIAALCGGAYLVLRVR